MTDRKFFLAIEGLDGSGKSEISIRLNHLLSMTLGDSVKLTFEPHDPSCAGLFIRQVLMKRIRRVSDKTLALAFAANRLDHCDREISPFLDTGDERFLICDRYYLSSLAYQTTEEIPIEEVFLYNAKARRPDLTIFLDASNETCYERMKRREESKELFEQNLNEARHKYQTAIRYLREKHGERIFEIDANPGIDEVLNQILEIVAREAPGWLQIQSVLSMDLLPNVFTLGDHRELTIPDLVAELQEIWNQGPLFSLNDLEETIGILRDEIDRRVTSLSYDSLGSLFLDYLERSGYRLVGKLAWSDLDAYQLEYSMPMNLTQRGVAMLLGEAQRYDLILKKVSTIEELSDFLFVFQPSKQNGKDYYYERDSLKYANGSKSLSPATRLIGKEELAWAILSEAMKLLYEEHSNTLSANPNLRSVFRERMASIGAHGK
jgi:dTMP kinase